MLHLVTLHQTYIILVFTVLHCITLCYTICSPHSNLDNPNGGCVFMAQWQAYSCKNLQHLMFVIESMDADTETRRLSPIALDGGNTGNGDYTDLLNGPMDHGERANLDIPISDKHEPHLVTRTSLHHHTTHIYPHTPHPHIHLHTPTPPHPHPHTLSLHRLVHLLHLSQASLHILLPGCRGNRLLCVDDWFLSLSPSLPPAQRWTE